MALKIRLRQQGRTNRAFYRLVVTDSRSPRDGKYVEALGWYNPIEKEEEKQVFFKTDRIEHWLNVGAQFSENAANIVAKTAPQIVSSLTTRKLAHLAKAATRRKASKKAKA
jgi:small subunit ribosomal protein S16